MSKKRELIDNYKNSIMDFYINISETGVSKDVKNMILDEISNSEKELEKYIEKLEYLCQQLKMFWHSTIEDLKEIDSNRFN
jgi:hypothetical protein